MYKSSVSFDKFLSILESHHFKFTRVFVRKNEAVFIECASGLYQTPFLISIPDTYRMYIREEYPAINIGRSDKDKIPNGISQYLDDLSECVDSQVIVINSSHLITSDGITYTLYDQQGSVSHANKHKYYQDIAHTAEKLFIQGGLKPKDTVPPLEENNEDEDNDKTVHTITPLKFMDINGVEIHPNSVHEELVQHYEYADEPNTRTEQDQWQLSDTNVTYGNVYIVIDLLECFQKEGFNDIKHTIERFRLELRSFEMERREKKSLELESLYDNGKRLINGVLAKLTRVEATLFEKIEELQELEKRMDEVPSNQKTKPETMELKEKIVKEKNNLVLLYIQVRDEGNKYYDWVVKDWMEKVNTLHVPESIIKIATKIE
jgi:hypothetical protein